MRSLYALSHSSMNRNPSMVAKPADEAKYDGDVVVVDMGNVVDVDLDESDADLVVDAADVDEDLPDERILQAFHLRVDVLRADREDDPPEKASSGDAVEHGPVSLRIEDPQLERPGLGEPPFLGEGVASCDDLVRRRIVDLGQRSKRLARRGVDVEKPDVPT